MFHGLKSFLNLYIYLESAGLVSVSDGSVDPDVRLLVLDELGDYQVLKLLGVLYNHVV